MKRKADTAAVNPNNKCAKTVEGRVPKQAQYKENDLAVITIEQGVTKIEAWAFSRCTQLKRVVVPEGVTEIEAHAFSFCDNLTHVDLPSSLKKIGDCVFACCRSLEKCLQGCSRFYIPTHSIQNTLDGFNESLLKLGVVIYVFADSKLFG